MKRSRLFLQAASWKSYCVVGCLMMRCPSSQRGFPLLAGRFPTTSCVALLPSSAIIFASLTSDSYMFSVTYGLGGTYLSKIILGNYGLSQQIAGNIDVIGMVADGREIEQGIIAIFETLPLTEGALTLLFIMLITFYATTFDSLTLVVSMYSYKHLKPDAESSNYVRAFWAIVFIIFPIGLIFAENSIISLQSVSIIAAFPIGIVFILIIVSFFKDAGMYLDGQAEVCNKPEPLGN